MTAEHLLQACPQHDNLRRQFWPVVTTVARKLFGSLEDLQRTAAFVRGGNRSVRLSVRQEEIQTKITTGGLECFQLQKGKQL